MALPKLYEQTVWHNNTSPALNEDNLNSMSQAIDDIDDRVIGLAGTIMEDVPEIREDLEILRPAIESIEENVEAAAESAEASAESALKSEGYAVGTQDGVEVTSGEYYQNNAKYYAEIANPPIENTVDFTDIITIFDAINKAAKDVRLKVEAVQDLHGYDKPWVGGAGKNQFGSLTFSDNARCSHEYNEATGTLKITKSAAGNWAQTQIYLTNASSLAGKTVTLSIKAHSQNNANLHPHIVMVNNGSNVLGSYLADGIAQSWFPTTTFTMPSTLNNLNLLVRLDQQDDGNVGDYLILEEILLEVSSGKTSFEPYTNICPITGWDNAKVTRNGKNLYNKETLNTSGNAAITQIQNGIRVSALASSAWVSTVQIAINDLAPYVGKSLTFKCNYAHKTSDGLVCALQGMKNGTEVLWVPINGVDGVAEATINITSAHIGAILRFRAYISASNTINIGDYTDYTNIQIEVGSTATEYEPYKETEELTISLGGTRYGGTLDVTSGVLTLTKGYADLGDLTWRRDGTAVSGKYRFAIMLSPTAKVSDTTNGVTSLCSHYSALRSGETYQANADGYVITSGGDLIMYIEALSSATVEDFKAAMNGVQLVYTFATPQTIQLTPTQVYLLYGYNTLFGDCGDISLTYDASGIIHIDESKIDTDTLKAITAASSDFADFKARIAGL